MPQRELHECRAAGNSTRSIPTSARTNRAPLKMAGEHQAARHDCERGKPPGRTRRAHSGPQEPRQQAGRLEGTHMQLFPGTVRKREYDSAKTRRRGCATGGAPVAMPPALQSGMKRDFGLDRARRNSIRRTASSADTMLPLVDRQKRIPLRGTASQNGACRHAGNPQVLLRG